MQRHSQESGRVLDGRYTLEEVIGRGGMGEVWAATDGRLSRPVAVKVLAPHLAEQPDARRRFDHEASSAAGLTHPNIVTVHDCGDEDGVPYLVMERLPGATVADELRRGPMSISRAVELGGEVLAALQCAHNAGVVHRDVKPGNVLLTEDGHGKVADFGIAKAIEGEDATMTTELLATPHYIAPERLHGHPATPATDLFAAGVLLYEMLSGQRPFAGGSPIEVVRAIAANQRVPLRERRPDLPPSLTDAVERALESDPSARFESADAMAAAIAPDARDPGTFTVPLTVGPYADPAFAVPDAADASGRTIPLQPDSGSRTRPLRPAPSPPIAPRTRRRRPGAAAVAGVITLILVLAVVAAVLAFRDDSTPAPATDQAPAVINATPGPAAPLPEPLEKSLRNLEELVQQ